eukprot:gene32079-39625_t
MAESEEARHKHHELFDMSFPHFDGFSTPHTSSTIQRVYKESNISTTDLQPLIVFKSLIKGGTYVASDCGGNEHRDSVVRRMRELGLRVDGLGECMHSIGPEKIELTRVEDTATNLKAKRAVIGRFLFNMAFENSIEPGYVTEKPWDALMAGTVPVYLGDAIHLKALLPHPKAAIFVADYPNITALVDHLKYLAGNETAYEEHRSWRLNFTVEAN